MKRRLKDDYSFLSYLFLGFITLDIYSLWCLHHLTKDLNEVCSDSNKKTTGVAHLILLSLVTCGLYGVFWWYRVADMMEDQIKKRNLNSELSGKIIMLCMLLSYVGFGIPSLYVAYRVLGTMNEIASDYNSKLVDKID